MVVVPAATFTMGRNDGLHIERPAHPVTLGAFCIDRDDATVDAVRVLLPSAVTGESAPTPPKLLFQEAVAWCAARGLSLPTDAQWEFAGRGCTGQATGASPFGALNMLDDDAEWVADGFVAHIAGNAFEPQGLAPSHFRTLRGERRYTIRSPVGPIDSGQLVTANLPLANTRCVGPARR
jgi:hypothetical protein